MSDAAASLVFGPVPSRRLGRSLGINNIPPKVCTYSCVYCQLGRTDKMSDERRKFFEPDAIVAAVEARARQVEARGDAIDYLTFVPDGEPTLDIHLGAEIRQLRPLMKRIAVITNSSLVHLDDVREDLASADWVSTKVDAVDEAAWHKIDRPHRSLELDRMLHGLLALRQRFPGELVTETMLVSGVNDSPMQLEALAAFLEELQPAIAYLAIPTRPPAEPWVTAPDESVINQAYHIVHHRVEHVELLIGYEGTAFSASGHSAEDLLSITSVHPMREDAVKELLSRNGDGWEVVDRLVEERRLVELSYQGQHHYLRRLH